MDTEKLKSFMGLRKKQTQASKEFEIASANLKIEADAVRGMMKTPGWELTKEFLEKKTALIAQQMTVCKPEELLQLQLELKIMTELFNFFRSKILRDEL